MIGQNELRRRELPLILGAFAAYTSGNLIHNNLGLDPAIVPAAVFVGLVLWRRRRWLLLAAAMVIGLPAFMFLRWSELSKPGDALPFLNHVALLVAGVLAVMSAVLALIPSGRAALQR
ncbi:MAG: hypothetical protein ACREMQ_22115 [Longimicrobiales bacterium]